MQIETRGKGIRGTIRRASLLPVRYGLGPDRILSRLLRMASMVGRWEAMPTIPVTAIVLERHPTLRGQLAEFDLAVHGYRHVSYADLSREEKAADLQAACQVFANRGLAPRGFRAPYLQADEATLDLVRGRKFLFDSSTSQFALPPEHPLTPLATRFVAARYGSNVITGTRPTPASIPVELPVAQPDDEILVDGLGLRNAGGLWRVYEAMMDRAAAAGSHLVIQVHPERFHICEPALELLLAKAADVGGWLTSLSKAAEWHLREGGQNGRWPRGHAFALSITGDLDAVAIGDFALRLWGG